MPTGLAVEGVLPLPVGEVSRIAVPVPHSQLDVAIDRFIADLDRSRSDLVEILSASSPRKKTGKPVQDREASVV